MKTERAGRSSLFVLGAREDLLNSAVALEHVIPFQLQQTGRVTQIAPENRMHADEGLLTSGGVENVDVGVDVGVAGAGHLDKGGSGEDQYVGAGGVLRGVELRRLHVQRGAATKHRTRRHGI